MKPNAALAHYGPGASPALAPPNGSLVVYEDHDGAIGVAVYMDGGADEDSAFDEPGVGVHSEHHIKRWWFAPGQEHELAPPAAELLDAITKAVTLERAFADDPANGADRETATIEALDAAHDYVVMNPPIRGAEEARRLLDAAMSTTGMTAKRFREVASEALAALTHQEPGK